MLGVSRTLVRIHRHGCLCLCTRTLATEASARREGIARLVANVGADGGSVLTEVSHRSPARLHPMGNSKAAARAGAAWCTLGGFGGGVVGGDRTRTHVEVQGGATLALFTQGHTKLYKAKRDGIASRVELKARVAAGGLLVLAPDPLVPYAGSRYTQDQRFELEPGASAVVVDACTAGRAALAGGGERWLTDLLNLRTEFHAVRAGSSGGSGGEEGSEIDGNLPLSSGALSFTREPFLADAIRLDSDQRGPLNWGMDVGGVPRDAFASITAVGEAPAVQAVARNLQEAAALLAHRSGARVNEKSLVDDFSLPEMQGAVVLGVSPIVRGDSGDAMGVQAQGGRAASSSAGRDGAELFGVTARLVAEVPDDLTRLLHACLLPLEGPVGAAPYANRVHASGVTHAPGVAVPAPPATEIWDVASSDEVRAAAERMTDDDVDRMRSSFEEPSAGGDDYRMGSSFEEATRLASSFAEPFVSFGDGEADTGEPQAEPLQHLALDRPQLAVLMQLSDATLPTGGFAHSGGLEASVQLGVLGPIGDATSTAGNVEAIEGLREYMTVATVSHATLHGPFTGAAYGLADGVLELLQDADVSGDAGAAARDEDAFIGQWGALDAQLDSMLRCNVPGRRASLKQGQALANAACVWLEGDSAMLQQQGADGSRARGAVRLLRRLRSSLDAGALAYGHAAPVLGVVGAALGLDARPVLDVQTFAVSRDLLAAAVRMNLVGPIAAIALQAQLSRNVLANGSSAHIQGPHAPITTAAGASPIVDSVQACHDMLDVRLFQT